MPGLPLTSAHLSDMQYADMIEQYGGTVDSQFAKESVMRKIFPVKPVRGTDTLINRRVGRTTLKAITPGVRPDASPVLFGRTQVVVDTLILARENQSQLNEFQSDFDVRKELGEDHGKELGKFFDEAFLIQAIKAAYLAAPAGLNGAFGAGKNSAFTVAGQDLDPDLLYKKITGLLVRMQEEDIDTKECAIWVRPTHHEILVNHDKLVDKDFSEGNGNFSLGRVGSIMGSPVMSTARIPNAPIVGHKLSNARNANAYDVSAAEAKAVVVIMHPKSLLAGETIPLNSDVFFSREERQWFIDSFMAFGVNPNRGDCSGVVTKF